LERDDLRFVHHLDNNASIMRYWFEEPYATFDELTSLYDSHVHDQTERRFVVEHGVVAQMPVAAEVGSGDERDELGSG